MKAVISNRIFLETTPELEQKIEGKLTYTLPPRMPLDPPIIIKTIRTVRPGLVSIPIGRMDLIPEDYEIVDKRVTSSVELPEFKFDLRPSQEAVYSEIQDNAIINAWVSWGKTFTGLAVAGKLGQKTLIVTHTTNLRSQWEKEVKKVYGFTPGTIGGGVFNTEPPIVCGNIQTLYRRIEDIKHLFGTIILDEMHHVSSPTFTRIIDEMPARYKIGLTGTLERKDGRHVIFRDYFSNHVLKPPKENFMVPSVDIIKSGIRFLDGSATPWAEKVNHLCFNADYIKSVSLIAAKYAALGHKVLVVSNRVHFLKTCARLVGDNAVHITGDMDFKTREDTIKLLQVDKDVLFGTQSIFSEGISVNELSCIILATPINNEPLLTQLIGRVLRKQEGKLDPKVVDIHLVGRTAARQNNARLGYYMKQGYEVHTL
jgi:superfamily II DNA or RNA helicase